MSPMPRFTLARLLRFVTAICIACGLFSLAYSAGLRCWHTSGVHLAEVACGILSGATALLCREPIRQRYWLAVVWLLAITEFVWSAWLAFEVLGRPPTRDEVSQYLNGMLAECLVPPVAFTMITLVTSAGEQGERRFLSNAIWYSVAIACINLVMLVVLLHYVIIPTFFKG